MSYFSMASYYSVVSYSFYYSIYYSDFFIFIANISAIYYLNSILKSSYS